MVLFYERFSMGSVTNLKKRLPVTMLIVIMIIAIITISFYYLFPTPSEPTKILTDEEEEVYQFIITYYSAVNRRSFDELYDFFLEDAALLSAEGKTYLGVDKIETYYENLWLNMAEYGVKQNILSIEVDEDYAKAIFCSLSIERTIRETIPHYRSFKNEFILIKKEGNWKIAGVTMEKESCWDEPVLY